MYLSGETPASAPKFLLAKNFGKAYEPEQHLSTPRESSQIYIIIGTEDNHSNFIPRLTACKFRRNWLCRLRDEFADT
jgi:hypothetical protein